MKRLNKMQYIWFLLKPYIKYGRFYMFVQMAVAVVLGPIASVLAVRLPEYVINAIMYEHPTRQLITTITLFTLGIAVVHVLRFVIDNVYGSPVRQKISYKISQDVHEKALHTDLKHYDSPDFYAKYTFTDQQFAGQAGMASRMVPSTLQSLITAITMGALIAQTGPVLMLITFVFVGAQTLLTFPTTKANAALMLDINEVSRPMLYIRRIIQERENAMEMRASSLGTKVLRNFETAKDNFDSVFGKYLRKVMKFEVARGFLSPIQNALMMLYLVIFVVAGDRYMLGTYTMLYAAAGMLVANISGVFSTFSEAHRMLTGGENIARFFETESIIEPPEANVDKPVAPDGLLSVEIHNVSFSYDNSPFSIKGLNLKIPAGGRIAIVGENGGGKSTLTKLLLRMYDVDEGTILINGRDIRDFDVHSLRHKIGIAYQDVRVMALSLRDSLTAYHDIDDDELCKVATKLGLGDVLEKIDNNLDTMLSREFSKDGIMLSGGQAQRMTLARLFTGHFGLLLLDEPSSALDPLAEYNLMKIILDKANTATTIMIAHRLSIVRDFDMIYHVDNGKIIESGTHDTLMSAKGKYYDMFVRQGESYTRN